jgi:hypothetical protein
MLCYVASVIWEKNMATSDSRKHCTLNASVVRLAVAIVALALLAGCATAVNRQTPELHREPGTTPTIVVMPLDVELSQLTAGGVQEPQSEWTDAARQHMRAALEEEAKQRQVRLVSFDPERGDPADRDQSLALVALHRAVGSAVLIHQYMNVPLPSKKGKFDWSLGPSAASIARTQQADYALFLFVRDSYATAGRIAVIAIAALLGAGVQGGTQIGFASVVDLKTGDIVWFNRLARASGDLRTPEAAGETVKLLVSDAMK